MFRCHVGSFDFTIFRLKAASWWFHLKTTARRSRVVCAKETLSLASMNTQRRVLTIFTSCLPTSESERNRLSHSLEEHRNCRSQLFRSNRRGASSSAKTSRATKTHDCLVGICPHATFGFKEYIQPDLPRASFISYLTTPRIKLIRGQERDDSSRGVSGGLH